MEPSAEIPHTCHFLAPDDFCAKLAVSYRRGSRFSAFVGAGLSVPSAIPATARLIHYLGYWICRALHVMEDKSIPPWNPRTHGWPEMTQWYRQIPPDFNPERCLEVAGKGEKMPSHLKRLLQQAIGALADWRASLQFLSRIHLEGEGDRLQITLVAPEEAVIDQFFSRVIENRQPCLGHLMLAALSRKVRLDLILTPNFDHLIEDAFQQLGMQITSFEIHRHAGLPPSGLVKAAPRSLVKLHGGRYGLRADFSLDAIPSIEDLDNFTDYLRTGKTTVDLALIVAGLGATEPRVIRFIKHALKSLGGKLRIFWVYYTEGDRADCAREFAEELEQDIREDRDPRLLFTKAADIGLFFLQVYQKIADSPPPSGVIFPAVWNIPYPPAFTIPSEVEFVRVYNLLKEAVTVSIRGALEPGPAKTSRVIYIQTLEQPETNETINGAPTICSDIFENNTFGPNVRKVWLDLDDIIEPSGVFLRLILSMQRITGTPEPHSGLELANFVKNDQEAFEQFFQSLIGEIKALPEPVGWEWLVFLNSMNPPGSNAYFGSTEGGGPSSRWADKRQQFRFWTTMRRLNEEIPGLRIAWVVIGQTAHLSGPDYEYYHHILDKPCVPTSSKLEAQYIRNWISSSALPDEALRKRALIFLLAADRLSRYPTYTGRTFRLWQQRQTGQEGDGEPSQQGSTGQSCHSHQETYDWLASMTLSSSVQPSKHKQAPPILRLKPGGFLWMNLSLRRRLQHCFMDAEAGSDPKRLQGEWIDLAKELNAGFSSRDKYFLLSYLARSYGTLLVSSADPLAAFECLTHVFAAISLPASRMDIPAKDRVALVLHGLWAFETARELLNYRLTEQFSDRFLMKLSADAWNAFETALDHYRQTHQANGGAVDGAEAATLLRLWTQIFEVRLRVFETQGEYDQILCITRASAIEEDEEKSLASYERRVIEFQQIHERSDLCFNPPSQVRSIDSKNEAGEDVTIAGKPSQVPGSTVSSVAGALGCFRDVIRRAKLFEALAHADLRKYDTAIEKFLELAEDVSRSIDGREQLSAIKELTQALKEVLTRLQGKSPRLQDIERIIRQQGSPSSYAAKLTAHGYFISLRQDKFVISCCRRLAYLLIHCDHSLFLADERVGLQKGTPEKCSVTDHAPSMVILEAAAWIVRFALALLRALPPEGDDFVHYETARFRIHLALIRGRMSSRRFALDSIGSCSSAQIDEQFDELETILIDAEGYVEEFPVQHDSLTRAVIELRRAELKLLRFSAYRQNRDFRRKIRRLLEDHTPNEGIRDIEDSYDVPADINAAQIPVPGGREPLKHCGALKPPTQQPGLVVDQGFDPEALLEDAIRALRRAERLLKAHPKSVWWWQVLLVLKLKVPEYWHSWCLIRKTTGILELEERCSRSLARITYFEAAWQQVADQLQRFSHVDVFQLARATESAALILWQSLHRLKSIHKQIAFQAGHELHQNLNCLAQELQNTLHAKKALLRMLRIKLTYARSVFTPGDSQITGTEIPAGSEERSYYFSSTVSDYADAVLKSTASFEDWHFPRLQPHNGNSA